MVKVPSFSSLITRISLVVIVTAIFVQLIQVIFFEYYLKKDYIHQANTKISEAVKFISNELKDKETNLQKNLNDIVKNDSVLASLYFVNNYQDKNSYNAVLVDEEKKRLADALLDRVKFSSNCITTLFDKNKELIAYVIKKKGNYFQNFISYDDGEPILFNKFEYENEYTRQEYILSPLVSEEFIDKQKNTEYHYSHELIQIKEKRALVELDEIIGYVELIKTYNQSYFKELSEYLKLNVQLLEMLPDLKYDNKIYSLFEEQKNLNFVEDDAGIHLLKSIQTEDQTVYLHFLLNKDNLVHQITENRKSFLTITLISLFLILVVVTLILKAFLIKPLNKLMDQVAKIEATNYKDIEIIHTSDELEVFSRSLYTLADTINQRENDIQQQALENQKKDKIIAEQEKMASMGEMIGNIAHQWRQPLSVISVGASGMLTLKRFGTLDDEMFEETCIAINENAQYLSNTIEDFRSFIKGDNIEETFNVSEVLEKSLKMLEGTFKNNQINVIKDIDVDIEISSYPNLLIQCLMNILNNSKDVLKEKGNEDRWIKISLDTNLDNIKIIIEDNGGGIPQDVMPKIFDPYFTTKHQSQGTGLGLHMSYRIITENMHGKLYAQNSGYGAQFFIELPLEYN